jgi:hypothetical protein
MTGCARLPALTGRRSLRLAWAISRAVPAGGEG